LGAVIDEAQEFPGRSSRRWLHWLDGELAAAGAAPREQLIGLWDALGGWFATDGFAGSFEARAAAGLAADGEAELVAAHRAAVAERLRRLAAGTGVADPDALAAQLQVLLEGAVVGALVDRDPEVARVARQLTIIALDAG
jgi:hypothetical protein